MYRVKQGSRWTTIRDWADSPAYAWTPEKTGTYIVEVQARTRGRRGPDATGSHAYSVVLPQPLDAVTLLSDRSSPREVKSDIILTAEAQGAESETSRAQYLFRVKLGSRWTTLQDWGPNAMCLWQPDKTGTYTVEVQARTKGRPSADVKSTLFTYEIKLPPAVTEVELGTSVGSPQEIKTGIELTAKAKTNGIETDRAQYLFRAKLGSKWKTLQNWSGESSYTWIPDKTGKYIIEVQARTKGRPSVDKTAAITDYEIKLPPELTEVQLVTDPDSLHETGASIPLNATAKINGDETDHAQYLFRARLGRKWMTLRNWSGESSYTWIPDKTGKYIIEVQARTKGRPSVDKTAAITDFEIKLPPELTEVELKTSADSPQEIKASIALNAAAKIDGEETDRAQYLFRARLGSKWKTLQDWSAESGYTWIPDKTGKYIIEVQARTAGRPSVDKTAAITDFEIKLPPELTEVQLVTDPDSLRETGASIRLNAAAKINGEETDRAQYLFRARLGRKWKTLQDWSRESSYTWIPDKTGQYTIEVQARTAGRPSVDKTAAITDFEIKLPPELTEVELKTSADSPPGDQSKYRTQRRCQDQRRGDRPRAVSISRETGAQMEDIAGLEQRVQLYLDTGQDRAIHH